MATKKNATIPLDEANTKKLEKLIDFFQQTSIGNISRATVMLYLIEQAHKEIIEEGRTPADVFKY